MFSTGRNSGLFEGLKVGWESMSWGGFKVALSLILYELHLNDVLLFFYYD